MLRAMLRDLRAHRGRVAMTLVAIVLGVAFVVATWVVSESVAKTVSASGNRTDLAVSVTATGPDGLTAADKDRMAAVRGVGSATGVVHGQAQLVHKNGKVGESYWADYTGTSWDSSSRFNLVTGRGPQGPGEVALGERDAVDAGLKVGDTARIALAGGRVDTARVVGLYAYRSASPYDPTPAVAYAGATAWEVLGGKYERIELTAAPGTSQADLATAVRALGDYKASTGDELAREAKRQAASTASSVRNMLLAFAAVALVVGMFVIANTFTMLVTQRTRQFALLRAVGAARGDVRRAVLAEAGVLGLVGATVGTLAGVGLGWGALVVLRPVGQALVFAVPPVGIAAGYAVGVLVTVVAAWASARRAAAVPPVAALRTDAALPRRSLVVRTVVGLLAMAAGGTAVAVTSGTKLTDGDRVLAVAGALVIWAGVFLLAPVLVTGFLRPVAALAGRGGPVSRLALRNAVRDPRRTAATASALMIGLALVCAFGTVGASFVADITSATRALIPAGTSVVKPATFGAVLTGDDLAKAAAVPGVTTVMATRSGYASLPTGADPQGYHDGMLAMAVDPAGFGTVYRPTITAGTADLRKGVLVNKKVADRLKLRPGSTLTVAFGPDDQRREVTVAGLFTSSEGLYLPGMFVDQAAVPAEMRGQIDAVYLTGGNPAAVRAALDKAFADRPNVRVTDREGLIAADVSEFEFVLSILYALLGAAVLIAVFGVVNTLALSVLERTREIGVLRAIGATRRLIRGAVRLESVVIATYGGLLGVAVGLGLGAVMQHAVMSRPLWKATVPYDVVGTALAGMVVVGVLAAVWPARRAAKTDVLAAIATE